MTATLRRIAAFLPFLGLFLLAGCAQQDATSTGSPSPGGAASPAASTSAATIPAGSLKVALITPDPISGNWGKLANQGIESVKKGTGSDRASARRKARAGGG